MHSSCSTCATTNGCAWCGSLDACVATTDTYVMADCFGVVFEPPCPPSYVQTTTVEGNLIVLGDASLGGGNIHVEGPCNDDGCRESGLHSLTLDGSFFDVKSAGPVSISAGNSDRGESQGSEIMIKAGDGTNTVGGAGGDFFIFGGQGSGGKLHPFHLYFHN
mmetsp:Transcript_37207/g.55671  ORF Transcript_37207/g.55671 Transcript_37207/m.55671 type:complete len:162 (+) Transcript_37207:620-1105(+)